MSRALDPVTEHHLSQVADRLGEEFSGIFSEETIARYLTESMDLLGEAQITVYVPRDPIRGRQLSAEWHRRSSPQKTAGSSAWWPTGEYLAY